MVYALIFVIIILLLDIIINKTSTNKIDYKGNINYNKTYEKKNYLLTQKELKFYKLLKSITNKNNLNLFTQVALYEIIKSKNIKDFNKIKSKTIDFVITDSNSSYNSIGLDSHGAIVSLLKENGYKCAIDMNGYWGAKQTYVRHGEEQGIWRT